MAGPLELSTARTAIRTALDLATEEQLKRMLCAVYGHPPVISMSWGQVVCARCAAVVGDTLTGHYPTEGNAVLGHECEQCQKVLDALTVEQRLLTQTHEEN